MKPEDKRDTTGQLGHKGAEEQNRERERAGQPGSAVQAVAKEVRQLTADLDARYQSSTSDAGAQQNQGGNLGGPGNFGGGSLDPKAKR